MWIQYFDRGRRVRKSTRCERHKEASEVLKKALLTLEPVDDGAPAIAALYASLLSDYLMNGRKSVDHLRGAWKNHLKPVFAEISPAKLTSDQISDYVRARQAAGAANASINRELSALKRMFKLAQKTGKLKTVPYIPMLKERNVRKGFVKDSDYEALGRETSKVGLWLHTLFELGYTYGWRKSELTEMRVDQVDIEEGTIELNPGETKNDEARVIEMTTKVKELLAQCIAGKEKRDLVFTRAGGQPIGNFRRVWARVTRDAGAVGLLFHDLRRSGVRNMRRAGITEKVIMRISGHKTRSVFERYNIVDTSDLKAAAVKIEEGLQRRSAVADGSEVDAAPRSPGDA